MKKLVYCIIVFCIIQCNVKSQTNVSGTISTDSVWNLAGSPYIVTSTLSIGNSATLTVDSGVIVQFNPAMSLIVRGTLDAYKCTFTSSQGTKNPGDWNCIQVGIGSYAGSVFLDGCLIEYGGHDSQMTEYGMVEVENGTLTIKNGTLLQNSYNAGINITGTEGETNIEGAFITSCEWPVVLFSDGNLHLTGTNNLTGNNNDKVSIAFSTLSKNYFFDTLDIPYLLSSDFTIASGMVLNINNNEVQIDENVSVIVQGTLIASNTIFTSSRSSKNKGDWNSIQTGTGAYAGSVTLNGCTVEYGGYSTNSTEYGLIEVENGTLTLTNNTIIQYSNNAGLIMTGANGDANVEGATITSCEWPVVLYTPGDVIFTGTNIITGNTNDKISIAFTSLNKNYTLDTINIPYLLSGDFTIETGMTLNILNNEFQIGSNMWVLILGELNVYHSTFTSSATSKHKGDWENIIIGNGGTAGSMLLDGCTVEYGGFSTSSINYGMVKVENGTLEMLNNSLLRNSYNAGLIMTGTNGDAYLEDAVITSCEMPVVLILPGDIIFNGVVDLSGNEEDKIYMAFSIINKDYTLDTIDIPYLMTNNLTVSNGYTLTTLSNEILINSNLYLSILGSLDANNCVFTSSSSTKQKGDWQNIRIGNNSYSGYATFDNCIIEYGGYNTTTTISNNMVLITRGNLNLINGSILQHSNNMGININTNGQVLIENSWITDCNWPVYYSGPGSLELGFAYDLTGNTHNGIYISHSSNSNTFYLDTASVPYYFNANYTVNTSGSLEIASGNIVKMNNYVTIHIEGNFEAIAGSGEHIYFTTIKDDNLGGDTNDDGTATIPTASSWGAIDFEDNSHDANCIMKRCTLSYGGYSSHGVVITEDASPTIDSCNFNNNYFGSEFRGLSYPKYRYNTIGSSTVVPIAMTFDADPVFENNTFSFSDNEYDAIGLLESTLKTSSILKQRDVTGYPNVTYLLLGTLTIPADMYLIINKGIVIKGYYYYHRIIVKGTLIADGEDETNRIILTSAKDDKHGNPMDTNKDGTQTVPETSDWGGIVFEGTSSDSCELNFCSLKYASMPSIYYNSRYISQGAITMVNANPIITNCIIQNVNYGIYAFQASNPIIQNCEISNSIKTPIALSVSADPVFNGNSFTNVGWTALGIIGEELGHDGTIKLRNVAGYDSISYVLLEDLTINSGTYVDIDPGVVIKNARYADIFVNGGLKAQGTYNDTIVFTSIRDDNHGNPHDTENDGDAYSPAAGDWGVIRFNGSSDDNYNIIDYSKLLYGGYSSNTGVITFNDAGGRVQNTLISDGYVNGIRCEGSSQPVCSTNVEIRNCVSDPIAISLKSDPIFSYSGVKMISNGNGSNGIKIIEGTLNTSDTLRKRDVAGVYNIAYIVDQLTIASGAVLTLEPGVVIKFPDYYYYRIDVNGALVADGTPSEKIVFTSIKDDSKGGDTNDDGNQSVPQKSDWWAITFNNSDLDSLNILDNCIINYGGADQPGYYYYKDYGNIRIFDASVIIDSCLIEQCGTSALGIYGSADPQITYCEINNIYYTPVTMSLFSSPVFSGNTVSNLGIAALGLAEETYSLDATVPVRNFGGFNNITYYFYHTCTINSGTILTVPKGIVFKTKNYSCLLVEGGILINGEAEEPVVFTHVYDDLYGNPKDTNEDGTNTTPGINSYYNGIDFADISDDTSYIRHTVFRYFNAGINLEQAAPSVKHCIYEKDNWGLILNGVSNPVIDSCTFHDLTYAPLEISLVSYPVSTEENMISGTTFKAIGVLPEELVQDATLTRKNFAGINNIPYFFAGNYSIGTSVVLTVEPGVVMKFFRNSRLTVKRGLMALGGARADSNIVFTDYRDDFYGGDINSDSTATTPNSNNWNGILFNDQSLDAYCQLKHCIVRYAGYYSTDAAITTDASSPTITYSVISSSANGVRAINASNPLINYSDIYDNKYYGVTNVNHAFVIDAMYNWWGSPTGPTHSGNPGGTGDAVSDYVNYANFITVTQNPLMGDVSLNGYVQAYDASLILQEVAMLIMFLPEQAAVADVSGDGNITAYDASLILQYIAGNIDAFPAELKSSKTTPETEFFTLNAFLENSSENNYQITINASEVSKAYSIQFEIAFDIEKFNVDKIEKTALTADMMMQYSVNQENGNIIIAMADIKKLETDGDLIKISLSMRNDEPADISLLINNFMVNETNMVIEPLQLDILKQPVGNESITTENSTFKIYPNPVDERFIISYTINNDHQNVHIELYDITGHKLADLVNRIHQTGEYTLIFDINSIEGTKLLRGQYLIRYTDNKETRIIQIVVN